MTPADTREATAEAAAAAEQVTAHLDRMAVRMASTMPVAADTLASWDDAPRERLHAFLRMFEQLYDLTSRKLFRGLLLLSGETPGGLSMQNQFRRVEALGGIASADRWIELGATRNILVHDYPVNAAAQAGRANRAWSDLPALLDATRQTLSTLQSEGLIP